MSIKNLSEEQINELSKIVGSENINTEIDTRLSYARSTLNQGTVPTAIVKPVNANEIKKIIYFVKKHTLSLHPISTGKNWGYSDACAITDNQIIVDLSRMNRIIEVNQTLGYAVIEPGVTQGQLQSFLQENELPLWVDATGANKDTSITGNILERGFGYSDYGDRYANSCGYEIILPSGETLNTGFGHYTNSQNTHVYKWGVGPSLDGIFTQSNFGIITKLTIWLRPKPEDFKAVFFSFKEEEAVVDFFEKIRPLILDKTIQSKIHLYNDLRIISNFQSFPHNKNSPDTFLSKSERRVLMNHYHIGAWNGGIAFYGSKKQNKINILRVKNVLRTIKSKHTLLTIGDRTLFFLERVSATLEKLNQETAFGLIVKKIRVTFETMKGNAPASSLLSGLWKTGIKSNSTNPLDHNAGFYWISPIVPNEKKVLSNLLNLVTTAFNEYGFDLLLTVSSVNERSLTIVSTIAFNKENDEESLRAKICHDFLIKKLIESGYIPYRAGNETIPLLTNEIDVYFDFIHKIKQAIDPDNIISPGKYVPIKS